MARRSRTGLVRVHWWFLVSGPGIGRIEPVFFPPSLLFAYNPRLFLAVPRKSRQAASVRGAKSWWAENLGKWAGGITGNSSIAADARLEGSIHTCTK